MLDYSTDESNDRLWGLSLAAWVQIVTVTVLMGALFRFNLVRLWGKTNPINGQDSNWQHAIFVPLIGIYYLYIHRDELLKAAVAPRRQERGIRWLALAGLGLVLAIGLGLVGMSETGTPLMMVGMMAAGLGLAAALPTSGTLGAVTLIQGLLVFAYGIWPGQNDYIKDLGMVITLFGVVTLLCGWEVMKVAWFPIAFLVVALPWPELVYSKLAWPLQKLAASVAVGTLRVFGVTALNFGTKIQMVDGKGFVRVLNVAEACAGLKSVMTFMMVGATVAFLSQRVLWEKLIITASAIPIAIFCNVLRVSGQGLLDRYVSHEWSEGFAHQFAGLIMVIPGFFLIMLVGWVLERLFIEEVDRKRLSAAAAAAKAAKGKRMIVEVPRKKEAGATAGGGLMDQVAAAVAPGQPAVAGAGANSIQEQAVRSKVSAPAVEKPAVAKAPVAPVAKAGTAPAAKPVAAPAAKPVAKPAAGAPAKAMTSPASGLKPPAAKAPGAPGAKPALPPQGLKPSSAPSGAARGVAKPVAAPAKPAATPPAAKAPVAPPQQQQNPQQRPGRSE